VSVTATPAGVVDPVLRRSAGPVKKINAPHFVVLTRYRTTCRVPDSDGARGIGQHNERW
jgi:hypothetical protein